MKAAKFKELAELLFKQEEAMYLSEKYDFEADELSKKISEFLKENKLTKAQEKRLKEAGVDFDLVTM